MFVLSNLLSVDFAKIAQKKTASSAEIGCKGTTFFWTGKILSILPKLTFRCNFRYINGLLFYVGISAIYDVCHFATR